MESKKIIKGRVRKVSIVSNEDTYDIQTETSNFFANGVLVHNSEIVLRPHQFCNLTEVVVRSTDCLMDLKRKVRLATILGTLQSTLTDFRYINKKWKKNTEEERLLGVSMTGIMDNTIVNGLLEKVGFSSGEESLKSALTMLREVAVKTNIEFADYLDIEKSAAITCVKPSGCADIETKIKTSEGIMTLGEIFEYLGAGDISEYRAGQWVSPKGVLSVFDENNELKPITKLFVNGFAETYELMDEKGNIYNFTGEHKVKVKDLGWVRVDQLVEDSEIETY